MTKRIILLLVEGQTDEDALALVYSKLVKEHDIEFDFAYRYYRKRKYDS